MGENAKFDYGAWATKNNIRCHDGRIIRKDAFKDMDGKEVPLVWNHDHKDPFKVIGHALLENRDEGVYSYLSFNPDTELGKHCKNLVEHGDIKGVSIYANDLKQTDNGEVLHGVIRELSLVLAGANPGALIDAALAHGDDIEEGILFETLEGINSDEELTHASGFIDEGEDDMSNDVLEHSEETEVDVGEVLNSIEQKLSEEEMGVIKGLYAMALNDSNEEGEEEEMKQNAFEGKDNNTNDELIHSALHNIFVDAKKYGTLKDSILQHAEEIQQYGIDHMEYFQTPEGKDIYDRPQFIKRNPDGWVAKVLNGVHHTPFSKVRMMFADITEDEARAKGYIKGNLKRDEFFKLIKRTVQPTTIYKKQKFDRDDLADADYDIIPWVKDEMSYMLDEEKARAYIFGDGRSPADDDKIKEDCIIPVVGEASLFVDNIEVEAPADGASKSELAAFAEDLIDQVVMAQDDYEGSGNITAFAENKLVTRMLLLKDKEGRRLYKTMAELAAAMSVEEIVKVPRGIIPNGVHIVGLDLADYNVGLTNMGKRSLFSDFDIDFNQQKYLLEERESGCLTRPHSAFVLKTTAQG